MAQNGYTLGQDITLVIVTPAGPIQFDGITGFSAQQRVNDINTSPLSGGSIPIKLPMGWGGNFDHDRTSGSIDAYFANTEEAYYRGDNQPNVSIVEILREANGSVSEYKYTQVAMHLDDAGTYRGNDKTTQRIAWMAGRRIRTL